MIKYLSILFFLFSLNYQICYAQLNQFSFNQNDWTPWDYSNIQFTSIKETITVSSTNPFSISLSLWNELSTQDGPGCPFRPSCSGYMVTAIHKYGPVSGWVMGVDRLMRDHKWADDDNYPMRNDYFYDPVE
jgi:putative component of membrane protein insertase Oxa1/YidC/SpoIIIJ protein YidD